MARHLVRGKGLGPAGKHPLPAQQRLWIGHSVLRVAPLRIRSGVFGKRPDRGVLIALPDA